MRMSAFFSSGHRAIQPVGAFMAVSCARMLPARELMAVVAARSGAGESTSADADDVSATRSTTVRVGMLGCAA